MYQFLARVTNKQKEKNKQNSQVYYLWCVSYYFKQFVHLITHLSLLRVSVKQDAKLQER